MSEPAAYAEFDPSGPLPSGVTVLEASAGTGKTYTIAALAVRYVAEGTPLERLLLITFTRMATGELRDRVRERLVASEEHLTAILDGSAPAPGDDIMTLLGAGTGEEIALRRDRLRRAVSEFDAATIATTHGFCQEVLAELGTVGDLEPGTAFVEDVSDLLEEVLDDLYVRRFQKLGDARFSRAQALRIARAAAFNPDAVLEPRGEPKQTNAAMRYRLAEAVRTELETRKRQLAIMTYDDLLTRLRQTLDGPNGEMALRRLRSRYRVVLVDEFQDTDRVQWQILHRAFAASAVTLVLIADPKQAIYAFRGADVYAYLVAASTARHRATLRVNRRSDGPLLQAYDALFGNARLGHPEIVYRQVRAAPGNVAPRLTGAPVDAALRVRVLRRDEPTIEQTRTGYVSAPSGRDHIARDLAAEAVLLLSSGALIGHAGGASRAIAPGDVAVLVRTHAQADLILDSLRAARVPVVINGAGSVFATSAARDWLRLLEAVDRPASTPRARALALTPFIGWSAERVATVPESDWEAVHRRLHRWSRILRDSGVAELTETVMSGEALPSRLLAEQDGERRLTDLRHIAELLHAEATAERLGPTALLGWLALRIRAAEQRDAEEEQTRRLESDADAVQVLTIHRSKGLEFPVVLCPFLWSPGYISSDPEPVFFHDPAFGDERTIDVGLDGRGFAKHQRQHRIEQRGEDLRLAYVALTRARHQAVLWWAGSYDSGNAPLTRLLLARDAQGVVAADGATPSDKEMLERLMRLSAQAPGCVSVERSALRGSPAWSPPLVARAELRAARFLRDLDLRWRRTSYSDITAAAHVGLVGSEPEERVLGDEPAAVISVPGSLAARADDPGLAAPSLLGTMPVGVQFGTFVHGVLESVDFAAGDLGGALTAAVGESRLARTLQLGDPDTVIAGLRAAIETPLGPLVDGRRLADVARSDRLDELEFELPLVGGDEPVGRLTLDAVAGALRSFLPDGDVMAAYAARLEDPALRSTVRGYLTGSIDLVMRLPGPRFAIVDYKTNWLGAPGEGLTLGHYARDALAGEMSRAHYNLQALLYVVALHRYLRWRLRAYEPDRHLAGVLYLFVRGMAGPLTPVMDGGRCGVFGWRAPGALVEALSDVLDRGAGRW